MDRTRKGGKGKGREGKGRKGKGREDRMRKWSSIFQIILIFFIRCNFKDFICKDKGLVNKITKYLSES